MIRMVYSQKSVPPNISAGSAVYLKSQILKFQWEWLPSLPHSRPPECRHFTVETDKTAYNFATHCIWVYRGILVVHLLYVGQAYLVLPLQVELLKLGYYHTIVTDGQATTWLQQCFLIHKIVNKARHKLVRLLGSSETLYTIQKQFQSRSLLKLSFICLIPQSKNLQTC